MVKKEDRISIEEVIQSSFFDSVRSFKQCPSYTDSNCKLKSIVEDFIQRGNVHKFSGQVEFDSNFEKTREDFDPTEKMKLDQVYANALNFIFDIDPQKEKIESIKKEVQDSTKAAREKHQQQESSESEGEEPQEPEEPFSSMGCKFNPEDFEKLKLEEEEEKK